MRAHPIPQNVVSFEDRIFGPLTAKQFSIIAAGLSFAFVLYMSPLPNNLKLPLVIVIALFSFAAGLIKINDMALDAWLLTFFTAIYAPTQFVWEKSHAALFLNLNLKPTRKKSISPQKTEAVKKELYPGLFTEEERDEKEEEFLSELNFDIPIPKSLTPPISKETVILSTIPPLPQAEPKQETTLPPLEQNQVIVAEKPVATTVPLPQKEKAIPSVKQVIKPAAKKKPPEIAKKKRVEGYPEKRQSPSSLRKEGVQTPLASEINFTNKPVFTLQISGQEPQYVQGLSNLKVNRAIHRLDSSTVIFPVKGEKHFRVSPDLEKRFQVNDDLQVKNLEVLQIAKEEGKSYPIHPVQKQIRKETASKGQLAVSPTPKAVTKPTQSEPIKPVPKVTPKPFPPQAPPKKEEALPLTPTPPLKPKTQPVKETVFPVTTKGSGLEAPKPTTPPLSAPVIQKPIFTAKNRDFMPPQIPNIVAGIIKDQQGNTINNAIVIIKDENNTPVRALKSNKLGQFSIATPLPNGSYTIEIEKEGCQFHPIVLELKGDVVPLIEVVGSVTTTN